MIKKSIRVREKGEITIPVEIRRNAGIEVDDILEIRNNGNETISMKKLI